MVNGASMKMHEANPLNGRRDRVQGGIDQGEAIQMDRLQYGYHRYL
jgi:hypothetical protein